jgi:hypothetical protein
MPAARQEFAVNVASDVEVELPDRPRLSIALASL